MTRQPFDPCSLPSQLPATWMAVCIGVNEAKDCLYVARYEAEREPLFLSLPMDRVGRRENEEPLFQGELAFSELTDIIDQANSTSQRAKSVKSDDDKNAWWSQRRELDERLKILLANVEHRWLGVFKVSISLLLMIQRLSLALKGSPFSPTDMVGRGLGRVQHERHQNFQ